MNWNHVHTRLAIIFAFLFLIIPLAHAKCDPNLNNAIEKILADYRKNPDFDPSQTTQISILCPGESTPRDFAIGDATDGTPVSQHNLYKIGSLTKSFTSAIILQLEAEELLSINDKISKWLPNLPAAWKNITIKQLLNHTSGIPDYSYLTEFLLIEAAYSGQIQWKPDDLLLFVRFKPLEFSPGTAFAYSNTNYLIAGMIIEAVTGQPYETLINERLIAPHGLTNTFYVAKPLSDTLLRRLIPGYNNVGGQIIDLTNYNMSLAAAAGANISNSHDLALWLKSLLEGDVLKPTQLHEMTSWVDEETGQPQGPDNHTGYGLGLISDTYEYGEEVWYHHGGAPGYAVIMQRLNCRDIIMTQTMNGGKNDNGLLYNLIPDIVHYIQQADPAPQCQVTKASHKSLKVGMEWRS